MPLKSQQAQSICKRSMLAKMFVVPKKEIKAANVDIITCGQSFHYKLARNLQRKMVGRKDLLEVYEVSKFLHASSIAFGSVEIILRHEAVGDDT